MNSLAVAVIQRRGFPGDKGVYTSYTRAGRCAMVWMSCVSSLSVGALTRLHGYVYEQIVRAQSEEPFLPTGYTHKFSPNIRKSYTLDFQEYSIQSVEI